MTDILTRFVTAVESIAASLAAAPKAAAAPVQTTTKTETNKPTTTKTETKDKPADKNTPATTSGGKDTAAKGAPAGTTKAPGGKRSLDDVRNAIRAVATTEGLGKPDAINILEEEGGVKTVAELKPENYDSVYEACQVAIAGAGKNPPAGDDDDIMG